MTGVQTCALPICFPVTISAGIRRIEAVVGASAFKYTKEQINKLNELQAEIKSNDLIAGVKKLKSEIKELKNQIQNR